MPKVKQSAEQKQYEELKARIRYAEKVAGITDKELALAARITPQTLCRRINYETSRFTLGELWAISRKLHMSLPVLLGLEPIPAVKET